MSSTKTITIDPNDFDIDTLFAQIASVAEQDSWPEALTFRVNLAIEELALNTVTHGKHEGLDTIEITFDTQGDSLTIDIVDNGLPFNPLEDSPDPDLNTAIEDRDVGGLGVYLVHTLMDDMEYKRADGRNCVTLKARRAE